MSQQFCLKWNNHTNNMMDVFKNLLSTEAMVDVTLACDGLSLKAHKIVLSACSPFFQSLFLENPCKHPIVILKDMKYTELKAIIEFMYHGEVNVAQEKLSALMKTAETLRVKGLAEVTNDKEQSGDESSHRPSSRTGTPPPKRRKGRTRKRSTSDQSDDGASVSKTSRHHQDSDIEELSSDMDRNTNTPYSERNTSTPYSTPAAVPSTQTHRASSFHKSQQEQQPPQPIVQHPDDSFVQEEKYSVEPGKLLQQTLTTDDLPRRTGRPQSNVELQRRPQSSTDHSIVPVVSTPVSMSSDALVSADQQPESPIDIKPELLDLEPPMSPVAGPSHSADENSMMYMDQSNMSSMSGPSGYQDNSGALVPSDSQPQGLQLNEFRNIVSSIESFAVKQVIDHSGGQNKRFNCNLCPYSTNNKAHMKNHSLVHSGERPYKCELCRLQLDKFQRIVSSTESFAVKKTIHHSSSQNKGFRCNLCPYSGNYKSHLKQHSVVHSGKRPYKCELCSKSFNQLYHLKRHRLVHTREKPYFCDVCNQSFTQVSNLKRHMRIHTGEKPYSCDVCNRKFARVYPLR